MRQYDIIALSHFIIITFKKNDMFKFSEKVVDTFLCYFKMKNNM